MPTLNPRKRARKATKADARSRPLPVIDLTDVTEDTEDTEDTAVTAVTAVTEHAAVTAVTAVTDTVLGDVPAPVLAPVLAPTAGDADWEYDRFDPRWESEWEARTDGLRDDFFPVDNGTLTFRNDILCDLDVVPEEVRLIATAGAAEVVSVLDGRVVRTKLCRPAEGAGFVSALVNGIVLAGRSVRHILVLAHTEHAQEWSDSRIDQHGEGGKIMSSNPGATIPSRLLNERTLLIDEVGDANTQAAVLGAGGMAIAVTFADPL